MSEELDYLNKTINDAKHNITYLENILQNNSDLEQNQTGIYIKKQIEYFKLVVFYHSLLQKSNIDGEFITLLLKTLIKLKKLLIDLIDLFDEKMIDNEYKNSKEIFQESFNVYDKQYNMLLMTALK